MPRVRVIKISFDTILKSFEVPAFRGAIVKLVGQDQVAFHNHVGDEGLLYSYPIIQYKSLNRKAGIVCIDGGVDEVYQLFSKNPGVIRIGNSGRSLQVESVKINKIDVGISDSKHSYLIQNWLPLNEKNFVQYSGLAGLSAKIAFLEKMLVGNILSFAKGINWTVDMPIQVSIDEVKKDDWVRHKGVKLKCYDLVFSTNVSLPYDIGLGKGVSMGFGTLIRKNKN